MSSNHPNAPQPAPLPFFGTRWVDHSGGYAARRAGLGVGAALAAAAGAVLLRVAFQGLAIAELEGWISVLVVAAFAVCSALAFSRTLTGFSRRPEEAERSAPDSSLRSVRTIGFIGVLLAYAVRCVVEAPGEGLHRREYEEALARYERQRAARTRNPAGKRKGRGKRADS